MSKIVKSIQHYKDITPTYSKVCKILTSLPDQSPRIDHISFKTVRSNGGIDKFFGSIKSEYRKEGIKFKSGPISSQWFYPVSSSSKLPNIKVLEYDDDALLSPKSREIIKYHYEYIDGKNSYKHSGLCLSNYNTVYNESPDVAWVLAFGATVSCVGLTCYNIEPTLNKVKDKGVSIISNDGDNVITNTPTPRNYHFRESRTIPDFVPQIGIGSEYVPIPGTCVGFVEKVYYHQ
jgi:hypothetical protein